MEPELSARDVQHAGSHKNDIVCLLFARETMDVTVRIYTPDDSSFDVTCPPFTCFLARHIQSRTGIPPENQRLIQDGKTFLSVLITEGSVFDLLQRGDNQTPQHYLEVAVKDRNLDAVKVLVKDSRIDRHSHDRDGYTLLHLAGIMDDPLVITELLQEGYDPNVVSAHGIRPIDVAGPHGVRIFMERGVPLLLREEDFVRWILGRSHEILRTALRMGFNPNTVIGGIPCLDLALDARKNEHASLLVAAGAIGDDTQRIDDIVTSFQRRREDFLS